MSFRVSVTVNCALARNLHLLLNMASVCYDCEQQYTSDHFNNITSHSADVSFRQTITHGCLCKMASLYVTVVFTGAPVIVKASSLLSASA